MKEILLKPVVIAALIGLIANLIVEVINLVVSCQNNKRLERIEQDKREDKIKTYRYETLFDYRRNWTKTDTALAWDLDESGNVGHLPAGTLITYYFQECEKYIVISPLLEEEYRNDLGTKKEFVESVITRFEKFQKDSERNNDHKEYKELYLELYDSILEFTQSLQNAVHSQLCALL